MSKVFHRSFLGSLLLGSFFLSSCSNQFESAHKDLSQHVEDHLACKNFRSEVFNSFYQYVDQQKSLPSAEAISDHLVDILKRRKFSADKENLKTALVAEIKSLAELMTVGVSQELHPNDHQEHLQKMIEMEFEDISTEGNISLNKKLYQRLNQIDTLARKLDLDCKAPDTAPPTPAPLPNHPQLSSSLPLLGGHVAMATAYQSCHSLRLPAMTSSTDEVQGVIRTTKVDDVGYRREYGDLSLIQRTHYYLQGASYGGACRSILNQPMIYDYGGQPILQTQKINFFIDSGGGSALGVDCSAFISTALATAGLRYSSKVDNKPIFIRQTSAKFINPKSVGWSCFDRIKLTPEKNILPGDIMAIRGHVVMIDEVPDDPFGIKNIVSRRDCDHLSYQNFNFVILQSSPSKGSIGINRFQAKDYLAESTSMRNGFLAYAKFACYALVDKKTYDLNDSALGIIRHKGTPECKAPRVELVHESCITQCPELTKI